VALPFAVPETATMLLLASGLVGLAAVRRKSKKEVSILLPKNVSGASAPLLFLVVWFAGWSLALTAAHGLLRAPFRSSITIRCRSRVPRESS